MVTKIKIKVVDILWTMINEDMILTQYYLKIGSSRLGQIFGHTKYSPSPLPRELLSILVCLF